jgi:chemotaxis receptor (MCP) glutamine deamidase CheD
MGAQGNVRLRPKNGLLVLLFDAQAAQSCMAYLKDDTSTAAGELHARQVLDAMVCAMRRPGTRDEAIQAKTVGTVDLMATSKGHTADLHSFVNTWLQGAGIPLAATREVPVDTEMRIDLGTGRIRLASSSQPGIGAGVGSLRTSGPESGAGESR